MAIGVVAGLATGVVVGLAAGVEEDGVEEDLKMSRSLGGLGRSKPLERWGGPEGSKAPKGSNEPKESASRYGRG